MKHPTSAAPGYLHSLRSLGDGLLASLHDRVELFGLELQEEKFRLVQTFIWIGAIFFVGFMMVALASFTLVYLFWESNRLAVLGGLTVFYAAALVLLVVCFRRFLARQPLPLASTLDELEKDRACIQPDN